MQKTEFKPWAGGPCPVEPEARVYVTYRDGIQSKIRMAGDLRWEHTGQTDDIVGYREVLGK
jgi:hypothetical protein